MANALIMSKLYYNIEIWGDTSLTNRKMIDKILIEAAKTVIGTESVGRTNSWLMTKMNWLCVEKSYENAVQNYTYKIINGDDNHYFKIYLTTNRSIRNEAQNKVRHYGEEMGHSQYMQRTYLYRTVNIYNKLPRDITLIKNKTLFKKWVKRYNINNNIKLKIQEDYRREINNQEEEINEEGEEMQCYDRNDDNNMEE